MRVSKSNKVCGYVKARERLAKLNLKLVTRLEELRPLQVEIIEVKADVAERRLSMTGGQIGEAERILKNTEPTPEGVQP